MEKTSLLSQIGAASFPILTMQILGFVFKIVLIRNSKSRVSKKANVVEIIEFEDFDYEQINRENEISNDKKRFKDFFDLSIFSKRKVAKNSKKLGE